MSDSDDALDILGWSCPRPLRDYPFVVLGHGGGGKLTAELIEHLFLPAFQNPTLAVMGDAAVAPAPVGRLAFTTDTYVVKPRFFPGGCIGDLAVHGTVNDLAMVGAQPLYLSASFLLEEGLALAELGVIVQRMAAAARLVGVSIVTGDTKVVERGQGDGCFITTSGVGVIPPECSCQLHPSHAQPGDFVLVSGPLGNHGVAILSVREGLEFETVITSDTAPLHHLVAAMLDVCPELHVLRDPTRGGAAAVLNEIAERSRVGILLDEAAIPIDPEVQAACDLFGLDPLLVANEGKLIAVAPAMAVPKLLEVMQQFPVAQRARVIGRVTAEHPQLVRIKTTMGGTRVLTVPLGEQLPRIC